MNTRSTNRSGDKSFNGSFDRSASRNLILHIILDQVTETITPTTMILTTDKGTTGITIETEDTNTPQDTNKEVTTTRTGMAIIKIETGLTAEGNLTNTNTTETTTETNQKHKSSLNRPTRISWK